MLKAPLNLEAKIPPPVLFVTTGAVMWFAARLWPALAFELPGRLAIAVALGAGGAAMATAAAAAFRRARTTFNPLRPEAASTLVTSGVFRISRNPMYVGLLLALTGWAVFLSNAAAFLLVPAFVAYMNRFQIAPEERVLAAKFGDDFAAYRRAVRRWL